MEQDKPRNLAPRDDAAHPDDIIGRPAEPFDIARFDPDDYEWRPVVRRPRADGWTPEVQVKFIEALADTGVVQQACQEVDMSVQSAYRLRRAPGSEGFARAWDAALNAAADRLADIAFTRAVEGERIPVFDADGCVAGARHRYNDRLLMFLLRAYRPERYRHAHRDARLPGEAPAPACPPVAEAAAALQPPTPPDPHLRMPPEQLAHFVDAAEGVADVYRLYPTIEREAYKQPPEPRDHPVALERQRARARHRSADLSDAPGEPGEEPW